MSRRRYPSDLTDAQWRIIEPLLPPPRDEGRTRTVSRQEIINAILYVVRTGCQWRALPHDFPRWTTVYSYFRTAKISGLWKTIHDSLREDVRKSVGKETTPSAAVMDSQSAKTVEKGGPTDTTRGRK